MTSISARLCKMARVACTERPYGGGLEVGLEARKSKSSPMAPRLPWATTGLKECRRPLRSGLRRATASKTSRLESWLSPCHRALARAKRPARPAAGGARVPPAGGGGAGARGGAGAVPAAAGARRGSPRGVPGGHAKLRENEGLQIKMGNRTDHGPIIPTCHFFQT